MVHHQHTHKRHKNCNTSMLLLVVYRRIPHNSLITDLFLSTSVTAVCHGHSQSLHLNAHSKCIFIVTNHSPWMIVFALWLLILHHRYEQQIFKETWQWLHPWVPQCAWTWLSETTHLYQVSHMGDTPDTWLHQWHQVWEGETRLNTVDIPRSAKGF